jgi:hypothetical protein
MSLNGHESKDTVALEALRAIKNEFSTNSKDQEEIRRDEEIVTKISKTRKESARILQSKTV